MSARLVATLAAAVAVGAGSPAYAVLVRPCGPGQTGVVVNNGHWDVVTICLNTTPEAIVAYARERAHATAEWATGDLPDWLGTCAVDPADPAVVHCDGTPPLP